MGNVTDNMKKAVMQANNLSEFIFEASDFNVKNISEYLNKLISDSIMSKSDIIKKSNLDRTYAYHILNGTRIPSRDKLIALAVGMNLTVDETDELLKVSRNMPLYPRDKRDAIIIFFIKSGKNVIELNEALEANNLDIIS